MAERANVGTVDELQEKGCLTGKIGSQPVCVFWDGGRAYAVDDRCPHMGFPLHRGTVDNGLLTCHWHHARFDLESGGTLDPFADDVRSYPVEIDDGAVVVVVEPRSDRVAHLLHRLDEGLEQGLTLVLAKSVLGLVDALGPEGAATAVVRAGVEFGTRFRDTGWGAGLTVLTAMANVLPALDPADRALALVHGLAFVSRDTAGHPPRFPLDPLPSPAPAERLAVWYRRFVDTRSGDAAERALATAASHGAEPGALAAMMGAAATDHVFIDGGHTVDFTNKAFEVLDHIGWDRAAETLTTLAHQTAGASRSEETASWRHPDDLAGLLAGATREVPSGQAPATAVPATPGSTPRPPAPTPAAPAPTPAAATDAHRRWDGDEDTGALGWAVLGDDPVEIIESLDDAARRGATPEEMARAVAYAAALRVTRFHTDNDHADWDVVHHGFTSANAVHQLLTRAPTPQLLRGVYQGALKVFLDRFLNVPAARLGRTSRSTRPGAAPAPAPGGERAATPDLAGLQECWDQQGMVDEAGGIVHAYLTAGGDRSEVLRALGSALLREDAEFHWFQTYEAAARQSAAWPERSEPAALILAGAARFLAAHTPTRRELPQVVRIASRLRRGEALYESLE